MTGGVLRTGAGRLRLGWRLASFLVLAAASTLMLRPFLPGGILAASTAMLVGSVAGGWALLALEGHGPGTLGFPLGRTSGVEVFVGVGLGAALGLGVVAGIAALGGLRWSAEPGSVSGWLAGSAGALAFLAIPAAAEEALLRGYPLQALTEAWGAGAALLATSVVFGAIHAWNPDVTWLGVANVAAAGLLLGVIYLKTASLWYATGAHLGWNWSHGYLADVPVSGHELLDAPFYDGASAGPTWLGGGAFGPEGSAVATLLVLIAAWACWKSRRLRPLSPAGEAPWWAATSAQRGDRPSTPAGTPRMGVDG